MYNLWVNLVIALQVVLISLYACSEARAQGLVEARQPFRDMPTSSSSIAANRLLELQLKLEEARARASIPASGFGINCFHPGGPSTCYQIEYRVFQLGNRVFIQQGEDVTTRMELRPW